MLVVFEGVDGSGKSTQARLAAEALSKDGADVLSIREPGGTALGEKVRDILLDPATGELAVASELFLFMAARAQLVETVIAPAIAEGKTVIADRFLWSSIVYQGIVGEMGVDTVRSVGEVAISGVEPACVIVVDLDPDEAAKRRDRPKDRMEERGVDFQKKIRDGYLDLAGGSERGIVIDGARPIGEVHEDIMNHLARILTP